MKFILSVAILMVLACCVSASFNLKLFVKEKLRGKAQTGITFKDCGKYMFHKITNLKNYLFI